MSTFGVNNAGHSDSTTAMTQTGTFIAMNDPTLRFTATGLPTRTEVPPNSGVMAAGIGHYPPKTSQSENPDEITTVPVTVAKSKSDKQPALDAGGEKQHGFMGKLKSLMGSSSDREKGGESHLRVVYMPRREYLKYFARDAKRNYIGSEPERDWTDEQLDDMFGKYEPAAAPKAKATLADMLLAPLGGGVSY